MVCMGEVWLSLCKGPRAAGLCVVRTKCEVNVVVGWCWWQDGIVLEFHLDCRSEWCKAVKRNGR